MGKIESIKTCVELSDESHHSLFNLYNAFIERKENVLNENTKKIIGSDTITEQTLLDSRKEKSYDRLLRANKTSRNMLIELALHNNKAWANGRSIRVRFLGGSAFLRQKVVLYAKQWENFANIRFTFVENGAAEIRVSFTLDIGSWSQIGCDALTITDQNLPTMNFGWFDENTTEEDFRSTIIHEFGHSIGCIHEHQSPVSNIKWNKAVVYEYYRTTQTPPWTKQKVNKNVFEKYLQSDITNSSFDPGSIMLYPIPKEFTTDGFSVGWNTDLSEQDKAFIQICYPG